MNFKPRHIAIGLIICTYLFLLAGVSVAGRISKQDSGSDQSLSQPTPSPNSGDIYLPKDNQAVVASWPMSDAKGKGTLEKVQWHLQQGQKPGMANLHYAAATALLSQLQDSHLDSSQFWYMQASVLQHQHQFDAAMLALDKALRLNSRDSSALLLKANILMTTGEFEQAKRTCTELIGKASIDVASACSIEAASYQTSALQGYQYFYPLLTNHLSHQNRVNNPTTLWMLQIGAELALYAGYPEQAARWLEKVPLNQAPLSYVVLWADIQLALAQDQQVINTLSGLVNQTDFVDDPVLIRLAMAQRNLDLPELPFIEKAKQRVALRKARNDQHHAADLTRYYLYIEPNGELARRWALINYQQAKLFADKVLLQATLEPPVSSTKQRSSL